MILINIKEASHLFILDSVNSILDFYISVEVDEYALVLLKEIKEKVQGIQDDIIFG